MLTNPSVVLFHLSSVLILLTCNGSGEFVKPNGMTLNQLYFVWLLIKLLLNFSLVDLLTDKISN